MQSLATNSLSSAALVLYGAVEPLLSETPVQTMVLHELAHAQLPPPPWRTAAYELAARRLLGVRISDGKEHLCWYGARYKKDWWTQHSSNPFATMFATWVDFTWDSWSTSLTSIEVETENLENLNHALLMALRKGWVVTAKNGTLIKTVVNEDGN